MFAIFFVDPTHCSDFKPRWKFCSRKRKSHSYKEKPDEENLPPCSKSKWYIATRKHHYGTSNDASLYGTELTTVGFKERGKENMGLDQTFISTLKNRRQGTL